MIDSRMLTNLPEDVSKRIEFDAMSLLYREKIGMILDELTFKKITEVNKHGCIFLNYTLAIPELDSIEYSSHIERIPPLETCDGS